MGVAHFTLHFSTSLHTSHFTLCIPHSTLHTPHFTLHTPHLALHTSHSHFTLSTPHFTLSTPHFTLHTPHFTLHTSHSTLHTQHLTLPTSHSTLRTAHFTLPTSQCTFTRHNTSPFLTFPVPAKQLSLECHKVPRLPREMHFHTSQHITCSHFPHRQRGDVIRAPRHENDPQTLHHPQTPKKENKNPSLRIREPALFRDVSGSIAISNFKLSNLGASIFVSKRNTSSAFA